MSKFIILITLIFSLKLQFCLNFYRGYELSQDRYQRCIQNHIFHLNRLDTTIAHTHARIHTKTQQTIHYYTDIPIMHMYNLIGMSTQEKSTVP